MKKKKKLTRNLYRGWTGTHGDPVGQVRGMDPRPKPVPLASLPCTFPKKREIFKSKKNDTRHKGTIKAKTTSSIQRHKPSESAACGK